MVSSEQSSPTAQSRPLVAPPTLVLGGGSGAQDSPRASGFVLKPSALSAQTSNLKIYNTPTRVNNNNNGKPTDSLSTVEGETSPSKNTEQKDSNPDVPSSEKSTPSKSSTAPNEEDPPAAAAKQSPSTNNKLESKDLSEVVFGQNLESRVTNVVLPKAADSAVGDKDGFVFGQNLHERVANADVSEAKSESRNSEELSFAAAACEKEGSGVGTGDLSGSDGSSKGKSGEKRTLTETAEEHQLRLENEAKKGRLDEVEVVTGEEDESNVLQINCKLYIYEGAQYQERGRGVLRVNDKQNPDDGSIQSRVVMRTQGSLRVVLNTSVWSGMKVEHPSAKSIRLTGQSPEGIIGVFLVQCISPKDADQLFHALEWRVQALKKAQQQGSQQNEPTQKSRKDQADDDEDDGDRDDLDEGDKVDAEPERKVDTGAVAVNTSGADPKTEDGKATGAADKHDVKSSGDEGDNSNSHLADDE